MGGELAAGRQFVGGTVLHPGSGQKFTKLDDNAVVFRFELHRWRVLFLSELGPIGRKALLERTNDLHADILLCGLTELSSPELMAAVSPRLIVVGGVETTFKRSRARERPKPAGDAWTVTSSVESAVTLELTPNACRVETEDGWFAIAR